MPTYLYYCNACKHKFEIEQKISDSPVKECPECKKEEAQRQIAGGYFMLKGGGWYKDGYSGKNR